MADCATRGVQQLNTILSCDEDRPALHHRKSGLLKSTGDWFMDLFGFREMDYVDTQRRIRAFPLGDAPDARWALEAPNGQQFQVGRFWTPSLAELETVAEARGSMQALPGKLRVRNVRGDVAAMHCDRSNRHSTFQVASQFNCLEFVGPSVLPEQGVTDYVHDRTQGPACSIACGPATVYRNYFAPVDGHPGQRTNRMINNLRDLNARLGNHPEGLFFRAQGGYTLADDDGVQQMNTKLRSLDGNEYSALKRELRVGVQEDAQVTSCDWGRTFCEDEDQIVTQVFGSACSVSYSGNSTQLWAPFASLVLQASYEATLYVALLAALRHQGIGGSKRVFLTCLGGGVFGNDIDWIADAMRRACEKFRDVDLEVNIVTYYGGIGRPLMQLERDFSDGDKGI